MSTENFKQQQHDRQEEGKELHREDELRDLSKIPASQLPGANQKSIFTKIGEGISNAAYAISEKVGISDPAVEGHEELDRDVRRQVKKVNAEIRQQATDKGQNIEQHNDWEDGALPNVKKHAENDQSKDVQPKAEQKTSVAGKIKNSVHGVTESISQGISNLKEQVVTGGPVIEGHEELDRGVRKQVKKVNEEIRQQAADRGQFQPNAWEDSTLPKFKKEVENAAEQIKAQPAKIQQKAAAKAEEGTSIAGRIKEGVQGITQGVSGLKQGSSQDKEEERHEDGTKHYKTVKDGINEKADDLKHDQRVAALGGQGELQSKNPFQPLTTGENEENRTLGEKLQEGVNDTTKKISSTFGGAAQKVKSVFVHKEAQDKENAQQIA